MHIFIMYLLPTKETTKKADAPTETFVDSDSTSDEDSSIESSSKEIDASQIDSNSKENAEN